MRIPLPQVMLTTMALLLLLCEPCHAQDSESLSHFDYDKAAPLDIKTIGTEKRGNATVYDITYASPKGGVVPAYLVVPAKGRGPFAAIVWGHWYWDNSPMRNRVEFLDEAVAIASAGVASLLTDGPIARPGYVQDRTPLNLQQTVDLVQQVVDMRRGVDLLLARSDVDPKRLAYVGHSYNAMVGGILSGVERRFKAFVLMTGSLSNEVDLRSKQYQNFRQKVSPDKFDAFYTEYSWLDAGKYISHASPAFIFLQFATMESFLTPERAREYEQLVSEPKKFKLYDAPHALNAEARRDRIAFLVQQLKLKPVSEKTITSIPDLYQPPPPK
jgi:dienelactone hydrolase